MKLKLIAPARKPEWGEEFWEMRTLTDILRRKSNQPPLALPTLAALTPSDVEVIITDENVEPIDFDEEVDLVGITFFTSLAPRAYEIADEFRRRKIKVILGGIHASMLPEEAIQYADSVVIGEAEELWPQVISDFQKGNLQKVYKSLGFPDIAKSPVPRWDLLKTEQYLIHAIQTSRGCPFNCEFCSVTAFLGRKYRWKSLKNVIKEVELLLQLDNKKGIFFTDDNILANLERAKNLFNALIQFKIKGWWCQASLNKLMNDALLNLMYKAGCRVIFVGFESVSQNTLSRMDKSGINEVKKYEEIVRKVYSHGIVIFGSFIVGNDTDEDSIFEDTVRFIEDADIPFSMINILTPLPGTKLWQRLQDEGRIAEKDWGKYNGEAVCFKPQKTTPAQIQTKRSQILQEMYDYPVLYKRLSRLWKSGVLVRKRKRKFFSKYRIILTFKSLITNDIKKTFFMLKILWHRRVPSIVNSLFLGLNFHDYAYRLSGDDKSFRNLLNVTRNK